MISPTASFLAVVPYSSCGSYTGLFCECLWREALTSDSSIPCRWELGTGGGHMACSVSRGPIIQPLTRKLRSGNQICEEESSDDVREPERILPTALGSVGGAGGCFRVDHSQVVGRGSGLGLGGKFTTDESSITELICSCACAPGKAYVAEETPLPAYLSGRLPRLSLPHLL